MIPIIQIKKLEQLNIYFKWHSQDMAYPELGLGNLKAYDGPQNSVFFPSHH